jgi:hypothetical protein
MAQVNIEIENIHLAEMGVDQPILYAPFHFKESAFAGYWISKNQATGVETIIFYVGSQTFNCKNIKYNVELFESILLK